MALYRIEADEREEDERKAADGGRRTVKTPGL
jgi:hypothetical protein